MWLTLDMDYVLTLIATIITGSRIVVVTYGSPVIDETLNSGTFSVQSGGWQGSTYLSNFNTQRSPFFRWSRQRTSVSMGWNKASKAFWKLRAERQPHTIQRNSNSYWSGSVTSQVGVQCVGNQGQGWCLDHQLWSPIRSWNGCWREILLGMWTVT